MGSRRDLANGARHRPDLLAKYTEIEQRTGYTMHMSRRPLAELVKAVADDDLQVSLFPECVA